MVNVAVEVPAGIVTVAGIVTAFGSAPLKLTTKSAVVGTLRVTLPTVVPPFSEIEDEANVTESCATKENPAR